MECERPDRILWSSSDGMERDDDCACSPGLTAMDGLHSAVMSGGSWKISSSLYALGLPEGNELLFDSAAPSTMVVINPPVQRTLRTFSEPRSLANQTEHELAALGLLMPAWDALPSLHWSAPETLTAWLHITDACNLRCPYCYVSKSGRAMDEATGMAAVDAVFRSALIHDFRAVKLKYAGGEPTLNWSLIPVLHEHARVLADQHNLQLHATLLSNGTTLTREMVDWLKGEDVRLMISLDGIGASHDRQRPFIAGGGTFARVSKSIDLALSQGLAPYLSITVTPQNAGHLPEVVAFALERSLLFNFNFVRNPGQDKGAWEFDTSRLIKGLKAAFAVIEAALPPYRLVDALLDRTLLSGPHRYPCGAGQNYLVIDMRGHISRCQMELDTPITDIQSQDPLQAVHEWNKGYQNVPVDERTNCKDCPWRYWCAGGCPLLAYRSTGSCYASSPYCAVYKALFPELLRLEGLRLLKWQPEPSK